MHSDKEVPQAHEVGALGLFGRPSGQREKLGMQKKIGEGSPGEGTAATESTWQSAPGYSRGIKEWLWFYWTLDIRQMKTSGARNKKTKAQGENPYVEYHSLCNPMASLLYKGRHVLL